jgi:hypothetical protein
MSDLLRNISIQRREAPVDIARANELMRELQQIGFSSMELSGDSVIFYISIEQLIQRMMELLSREIGVTYEIDWVAKKLKVKLPIGVIFNQVISGNK